MTAIPAKYGDISFNTLQIALSNKGYYINRNAFEINYNLRNNDGDYNLLAELLSDKNMISLIIVKFRGKDKSSISERTDFGRISLITAYYNMKNRLISMFNDRLEIISYGGLPYKQTKEQFLKGVSIPRNSTLMRIFQDLDITEHTGHGIPKIVERYREEVFDISDNYINVIIPFDLNVRKNHAHGVISGNIIGDIIGSINQNLTHEEQAVLELLIFNPKTTQAQAAEKVNVSKLTISRIFSTLKDRGYILREGSNKNRFWKVLKSWDFQNLQRALFCKGAI